MDVTQNLSNNNKFIKFQNEGFIVEENFLDQDNLIDLQQQMRLIFWTQVVANNLDKTVDNFEEGIELLFIKNYTVFKNCGKHVQHLIDVWKLGVSKKIINYLMNVCRLQFPSICTRPVVMFNSKTLATNDIYHTVPFHQDAKSMQGSDNAIVVWFPLQHTTEDLGPLQIIPKSHKKGIIAKEINEFGFGFVDNSLYNVEDIKSLTCKLGDIVFFDSKLIHGSGNNTSSLIRWSCQYRYNDLLDTNFIQRGYPHPYLYRPMTEEEMK